MSRRSTLCQRHVRRLETPARRARQSMTATQRPADRYLSAKTVEASGRLHADDRIHHGFTFRSVLAEFRALRATVLRLYEGSGATDLADVRRFNEAIDEGMTESMDRFARLTDRFRDQLIGVLSHDLRTPLGAVTAGAALLAIPEDNPERRLRVVPRILNSAQRMERMIADLRDLANARLGGSLPLNRQPTDLRQMRVRRSPCACRKAEGCSAPPLLWTTARMQMTSGWGEIRGALRSGVVADTPVAVHVNVCPSWRWRDLVVGGESRRPIYLRSGPHAADEPR